MDLLDRLAGSPHNLLPHQGTALYFGKILSSAIANDYLQRLHDQVAWQNDEVVIFGKTVVTRRKVAWYANRPYPYSYTGATKTARPWLSVLRELKALCEQTSGHTYNSCLLNLYHDGTEGMGWHSDAEPELLQGGAIASLSFGAERKFAFKNKHDKMQVAKILEHGSLLVMKGNTQDHWLHRLPPTTAACPARISLTFRTIEPLLPHSAEPTSGI